MSLNEKTETDNSVMVASPSVSLSNAWRFNDVLLAGLHLSQLKVDSDASYSFTVGKDGNDSLTSGLQVSLSPTKASSFSLKYGLSVTGDLGKPADRKANNTLTAKYRLSF